MPGELELPRYGSIILASKGNLIGERFQDSLLRDEFKICLLNLKADRFFDIAQGQLGLPESGPGFSGFCNTQPSLKNRQAEPDAS